MVERQEEDSQTCSRPNEPSFHTPEASSSIALPKTHEAYDAMREKAFVAGCEWIAAERKKSGPYTWFCIEDTAQRNDEEDDVLARIGPRQAPPSPASASAAATNTPAAKPEHAVGTGGTGSEKNPTTKRVKGQRRHFSWGFRFVSFGDGALGVEAFKKLLALVGLPLTREVIRLPPTWLELPLEIRDQLCSPPFVWSRPEIAIITENNPVTGEHMNKAPWSPVTGYSETSSSYGLVGREIRPADLG
jgi:hypothetical protein